MKNLLFLVAMFATLGLFAQKVDLDGEVIPLQYLRLPKNPLPADVKIYSTTLSANPQDLKNVGMPESVFLKHLKIPGYKKSTDGSQINIELSLSDFKYDGKTENKTAVSTEKDKNGKEVKTTSYYAETKYFHFFYLKVQDTKSQILHEQKYLFVSRVFKTGTFNNYQALSNYLGRSHGVDLAKHDREGLTQALAGIQNQLAELFGYTPTKDQVKLQILDSEKHEDYAGFQDAYKTAKSAFSAMQADQPLDSIKTLAQTAIQFFEKGKDKYDSAEKSGKKLKYACLYNLALIHFWFENFDESEKMANAVIANDYDPKDGKRLLEDIAELREHLKKCSQTSRHFKTAPDEKPEAEEAPETGFTSDAEERVDDYKKKKMGIKPGCATHEGTIWYSDGKEVKGIFILDRPNSLYFGEGGTVRFAVETEKDVQVEWPDYKKVSQFTFDNRNFRLMPFKSANALQIGSKADPEIFEVLHESNKVELFLAYTEEKRGVGQQPEFVINKVKDRDMVSLNSTKFALNLDKGIRKEFSDCPNIVAATEIDGGFKRTPDQMLRLAKLYEECVK